jgi:Zn-dependent M28 family amino/carboxypeptidase
LLYKIEESEKYYLMKFRNVFQILITLTIILSSNNCTGEHDTAIKKERMLQDVNLQVSFGPRIPGSKSHDETVNWITYELESHRWETEILDSMIDNKIVRNIVGKRGQGNPWLIMGAHYDTRIYADRDPISENKIMPVPGANDGASGVAILLELGRILPENIDNSRFNQVWLTFFDAEDNGGIDDWDWILGSSAFVRELTNFPDAVVIVDMVGDQDLNIYLEKNSNKELSNEIWNVAKNLGYSNYFIPQEKYRIIDDHIPFMEVGVPVVEIIDFDYKYWHTTMDTPDKVSSDSLEIVAKTLYNWLMMKP